MRAYASRVCDADVLAIEIRVGVSTGEVVVRSVRIGTARSENLPIGQATGIAARIQSLAQAGAIVVSAETRRAAGEGFKYRRLGHHAVKGTAQPVEIFELLDSATAARPRPATERLRMLLTRVAFQDACLTVGASLGLVAAFYLLTLIGPTPQPSAEQTAFELSFARAFSEVGGPRGAQIEAALERALGNCERRADVGCQFRAMSGLRLLHTLRGDLDKAEVVARGLLRLAMISAEPGMLASAYCALGHVSLVRNRLREAIEHYERGIAIAEKRPFQPRYTIDDSTQVWMSFSAIALIRSGLIDQSRRRIHRALALARQSGDPYAFAVTVHLCLIANGELYDPAVREYYLPDREEFGRWMDDAIVVAEQNGYAITEELKRDRAWGIFYFGVGAEERIRELRAMGLSDKAAIAEGFYRSGNYVYPALKYIEAWGSAPEQIRLRGELLLRAAPPREAEAEECFRRAIATAQRDGARYYELAATLSLSQLLARQGKLEAARDALRPIFSWFTEGFDVPVMVRSKKLLDELDAKIAAKRKPPRQASSTLLRKSSQPPAPSLTPPPEREKIRKEANFLRRVLRTAQDIFRGRASSQHSAS